MRSRMLLPVALVAILLVAGLGLAGWAYAHRGYPDVVYCQETSSVQQGHRITDKEWIDPQTGRSYERAGPVVAYVREGRLYSDFGGTWQVSSLPPATWSEYLRHARILLPDGFTSMGRSLLAQAVGRVRKVTLGGKAALQFSIRPPGTLPETVWLAAGTLHPLQIVIMGGQQGTSSGAIEYSSLKRYPPGSLPADFFDPPNPHPTPWDRALGWVRQHLGGPSRP